MIDIGGPATIGGTIPGWIVLGSIYALLTVKGKEATFAVELMAADSELRKRHMEGFCGNQLSKSKSLENHQREFLKMMTRMLKCSFLQLMVSGGSQGGEGLSFL